MQTSGDSVPAVRVVGVERRFGKRRVLQNIHLEVLRGEVFGLLGPSGSGKTTLVRLIAGVDEADSGEVFVAGRRMPQIDVLPEIGYMAQSDALYGELTAWENLDFFASLYGLRGVHKKQRMEDVLALVDLADAANRLVATFSGGMRRRLSFAIALLHRPSILILDEPTVGIDPVLRKSLWDELRRMSEAGTTILVTTHVMDEAEKCSRLAMIRDGRLIATGSPDQLKRETGTATLEAAFLAYGGVQV